MRVLHVIAALDPRFGGPAIALIGLARAQREAGIDVAVASTYLEGESRAGVEALQDADVELAYIGPTGPGLRRHSEIVPTLERMIENSDVVHIHSLYEEIQHQAAKVARGMGVPYLFRPCGMLTPWSMAQGRLKKQLYMLWRLRQDLRGAAALHFTTQAERDASAGVGVRVVSIVEPNGVNLDEFKTLPASGAFRSRFPQLVGKRVVTFLGRIHPGKGLELLVPAFAKVKLPDAMLVIVGPDSENFKATIDGMIKQHGIRDRVIFTGMLRGADRIAALADSDLFALPSYHENFGIAVVEALAARVPVIVSDEVNVCREIAAAKVGAVVPTQVQPLADELNRWLDDDELRRAAAARTRAFVEDNYNWNRIAARWIGHYEKLSASRVVAAG